MTENRSARIVVVSTFGFGELNGGTLRLYYLSRRLFEEGFHLDFVVPSRREADGIKERFGERYSGKYQTHYSHYLPAENMSSRKRFVVYFLMKYALSGIIRNIKADLVFCQHLPAGDAVAASGHPSLKVLDIFDIWSRYAAAYKNLLVRNTLCRYLKWREDRTFRGMDRLITCTDQTRRCIAERFSVPFEKITVINDGVDTELFKPRSAAITLRGKLGLKEDDFVVTFHGGMKKHDGLRLVVEAAEQLKDSMPVKILFIGEGNECGALKTLSNKLGVSGSVVFAGKLEHKDIPEYLSISNAGVISRLTWQGDIAASMMECMACSVPVISADLDGLEKYFTDRKDILLFRTGDAGSLACRIKELYSDRGLYDEIRRNARNAVSKYSRHKSADEITMFIKRLLEEKTV